MRLLVTGGAGFIGSNIVEELLIRNYSVRVLDNFSTGKRENLLVPLGKDFAKDIELIEGDIRSFHIVQQAVKGIDVILHQAALPSVPRSIKDPITSNEVNVVGTLNILDAAKENGVKRVVYASSSSVYGDNPELPKHEGMMPNPLSPYAVSKLAGEKYCQVYSRLYGIETVILRYFNVFGPRQDPNSEYSAVIPKFIKLISNNQSPTIYGDGTQSRDFTYVANVVEANILAATKEDCPKDEYGNAGLVMNCACHGQVTLNALVHELNVLLSLPRPFDSPDESGQAAQGDSGVKPIYAEPRHGDIKHSFANINLIKKNLNFEPSINFIDGLKKTIEFSSIN